MSDETNESSALALTRQATHRIGVWHENRNRC